MGRSVIPCRLLLITVLVSAVGFCFCKDLSIAAFNVRIFGQKKADDAFVMDMLVKIILRYDIILIQEIRDSQETAIFKLKDQVNAADPSNTFDMRVSPRLGRSSSKEQYAFLYRAKSGLRVENMYVYDDGDESLNNKDENIIVDMFEREPFVLLFSSKSTVVKEFALGGIHIAPDEAVEEIKALKEVFVDIQQKFHITDVMVMGDLNADCSYVPKSKWPEISLKSDSRYHWLLGDDADTTVSKTNCAYDRFIGTGDGFTTTENGGVVSGSAKVFNFMEEYKLSLEQALSISDHFPIEFKLKGKDITNSQGQESRLKTAQILNAYVAVPGPSLHTGEKYYVTGQQLDVTKSDGTVVGHLYNGTTRDTDIALAVELIILADLYVDKVRVETVRPRKYRQKQLSKIIISSTNPMYGKEKLILDVFLKKYGNVVYV